MVADGSRLPLAAGAHAQRPRAGRDHPRHEHHRGVQRPAREQGPATRRRGPEGKPVGKQPQAGRDEDQRRSPRLLEHDGRPAEGQRAATPAVTQDRVGRPAPGCLLPNGPSLDSPGSRMPARLAQTSRRPSYRRARAWLHPRLAGQAQGADHAVSDIARRARTGWAGEPRSPVSPVLAALPTTSTLGADRSGNVTARLYG